MSNYKLEQLKRRLKIPDRQEEQPVQHQDDAGLGAAIQQLIEQAAQRAAAQQQPKVPPQQRLQNVDRQVAEHAPTIQQQFDAPPASSDFPPPVKQTKPPRDLTIQIYRDKANRPISVSIGNVNFNIQRRADGRISRMVQASDGVATTVPPAPLNKG